jgi:hypothetical protein
MLFIVFIVNPAYTALMIKVRFLFKVLKDHSFFLRAANSLLFLSHRLYSVLVDADLVLLVVVKIFYSAHGSQCLRRIDLVFRVIILSFARTLVFVVLRFTELIENLPIMIFHVWYL